MMDKIQKPEGSTWTDDQWDAIAIHGHDMLVAAAAGSGKTAVLVERIIRRISDEHNPVDVDRLLVATFTNAAAAEMRHRISEALEKALERNPGSDHIRRQLALIARASITTLHSFCLEVIRTHYQRIGLDPGFRIANETESELMRQDLLEELFEEQYEAATEQSDFWRLVEWFGGEKSDDALHRLVQRLYDESRSHPSPDRWLREMAAMFNRSEHRPSGAEENNPWIPSLLVSVRLELEGIVSVLKEAVQLADAPGGPAPYLSNLKEDLEAVAYLQQVAEYSWTHLYDAFQGTAFGKLKPSRGDQYDKELQERVKELRNKAKEELTGLAEELFDRTLEQYEQELEELAPLMLALVELVIEFGRRYQEGKKAKGLVDFGDLEHFCLHILSEDAGSSVLQPSSIALQYREHFAEVLLDEYQDTNRVQEAIVSLISREGPGNRFMVGDVKQSIYRFRLAEPGLFLEKYKSYKSDEPEPGQKIDLAKNFRSRRSVVDGVNYIFRQTMGETVGEIAYDSRAELVYGASYYPDWPGSNGSEAAELLLMDRSEDELSLTDDAVVYETSSEQEGQEAAAEAVSEARELETAQLEARVIAQHIRKLLGAEGGPVFQVYDKASGGQRDITYRDMVILLRATQQWSPVIIEELRQQGIPAYAELSSGYFAATEVEVLLSLLRIIDNPYQDIPIASVLRSPIVGLTEEQLAYIRIAGRHKAFYEAVISYAKVSRRPDIDTGVGSDEAHAAAAEIGEGLNEAAAGEEAGTMERRAASASLDIASEVPMEQVSDRDPEVQSKLELFLKQLQGWRESARQGELSELIWTIYRDTGFYDFVGGLPGGQQRQANLRALYDRAKQYEATSFRGLFRFLRFVERMKDSGGDLGTARALGEQENVVRIMSIHKSKGLEFPVVFAAGMAKRFNQRDLTDTFMVHKDLGFGPKYMDVQTRTSYPALPWLAIRRKMRTEMLAEEMRVLYVALTRAREKLYLLATVKDTDKLLQKWSRYLEHHEELLPNDAVAQARSYLDWIGPALMRHPDGRALREYAGGSQRIPAACSGDPSRWEVRLLRPEWFASVAEAAGAADIDEERMQSVFHLEPVSDKGDLTDHQVWGRLSWEYPYAQASALLSKTSVTELKRLSEHHRLLELISDEPQAGMLNDPLLSSPSAYRPAIVRRPRFLEQKKLNAAERGTVFHAVMQHIRMDKVPSADDIRETLADMLRKQLLTEPQCEAVDADVIASFFRSDLGGRLLHADRIHREVPFSYGLPAKEVYSDTDEQTAEETILLQGIIDCMFEEGQGLVLLDYKTDHVKSGGTAELHAIRERYRLQLDLYAKAVEKIWRRPVTGKYIFLFDGAHILEV
ncbi:helicase-exonuclease AddAB subunit AddA [Paenibacillus sp. TAB 01]|uniref:helicase-exonuclease AddAB subunit AddA n=1 Tax=Paenibacillus sp. TAB 01 TaxID=3368988 RepID=UPI0037500182